VIKINLPNYFTLNCVKQFFLKSDLSCLDHSELIFPETFTISPLGLVVFAAWGQRMSKNKIKIQYKGKKNATYINYMQRMHLFDFLKLEGFKNPKVTEKAEEGKFITIRKIVNQNDIDNIVKEIDPLLHLGDADKSGVVRYCISEILRNVIEHAQTEDGGFFCIQTYKTKKGLKVSFAVADCGIGFNGSFRMTDTNEALRQALHAGVSATSLKPATDEAIYRNYNNDNAGAGLFFSRAIAKASEGLFFAWSGDRSYKSSNKDCATLKTKIHTDAFNDKHTIFSTPAWQGTVIAMDILVDKIKDKDKLFAWIRKNFSDKKERKNIDSEIKFT
jgi:anti-sigma regulatory factor (Ser/Thr protein kinase)